jgi:dethiobiotin synthetase
MSPITSDATCLDVIATLRCPAILVTGTYLGALSHTLTALDALRGRGVSTRGIVVSESSDSMGLDDTVEALRSYGAADVPIHLLPRQAGDPSTRWLSAPLLTRICEADRD